jgi:hypothetical protein
MLSQCFESDKLGAIHWPEELDKLIIITIIIINRLCQALVSTRSKKDHSHAAGRSEKCYAHFGKWQVSAEVVYTPCP